MPEKFYCKKRVLITGGSGFIGTHLRKKLSDYGAGISILDTAPPATGPEGSLHTCDIRDFPGLNSVIQDISPDIVFHLAACVDRATDFDVLGKAIGVNIVGTYNLFSALYHHSKCRSIVVAGTAEEYGNNDTPFKECFREDPVSPYSFSKVCVTHLCGIGSKLYGLPVVVLRPTLAYGPGQEETMFIPSLIKTLLRGETFRMSSGEQTRDFVYIDDVVNAYVRAGMSTADAGRIFNIGSGKPEKIKDIAYRVGARLNRESLLDVGAVACRQGEIMSYHVDISEAAYRLGWAPAVDIEEGLRRTVESYASGI